MAPAQLVLGHDAWRRLFGADDALIGGTLDLHARDLSRVGPTRFVVLGVSTTPVRFPPLEADFELGVGTVIDTIDFWWPMYLDPTDSRDAEDRLINVVAKLRPGVTVAQAQAEMDAIARRQAEEHPEAHEGWEVRVVPLRQQTAEGSRDGVLLLSAATGLLLLIACANVATLLLARGVARRREVAVRAALGAARWRIARQFLIEATVLAVGAGALGVLFASRAIELARPWLPGSLPALQEMTINPSVLAFAMASAGLTAAVTGVAPALRAARSRGERLTGREARGTTDGARTRLVGVLVAAEVALTVVLLLGAGLLVRSALRAAQMEPGFNPASLLTMTVALPENKFDWNHNATFCPRRDGRGPVPAVGDRRGGGPGHPDGRRRVLRQPADRGVCHAARRRGSGLSPACGQPCVLRGRCRFRSSRAESSRRGTTSASAGSTAPFW